MQFNLSKEEIIRKVDISLKKLSENDSFILKPKNDLNERTVSMRLAIYLAEEFVDYDVDCEYNRMINKKNAEEYLTKKLNICFKVNNNFDPLDIEAKTVYPDIIVHKRGTEINILVIEVKMGWKNSKGNFDIEKVKEYKKQLGYCHGLFLIINGANDFNKNWID